MEFYLMVKGNYDDYGIMEACKGEPGRCGCHPKYKICYQLCQDFSTYCLAGKTSNEAERCTYDLDCDSSLLPPFFFKIKGTFGAGKPVSKLSIYGICTIF